MLADPVHNEPVYVTTKPSLFRSDLYTTQVPDGSTIRDIVGPKVFEGVRVEVNGDYIEREKWNTQVVFHEDIVTIAIFPGDSDGGKNPWKTVAMIAVMVVAAYAGPAMMGAAGLEGAIAGSSVTWGAVGSGLVMTGGMMGVNALIPPQMPEAMGAGAGYSIESPAKAYSITGGQNRANRYGVVQKVIGFTRYYPNRAANPYSEIRGNEQYYHMLFCAGYANLNLSDYKLGDTLITDYDDVRIETGYIDEISIFRNSVLEEGSSVKIDQGQDVVRGLEDGVTDHDLSIDLIFPMGLRSVSEMGEEGWAEVQIRVEVSEKDADVYTVEDTITYRTSKKDPIRENISFSTTTTGEGADVRVTNISVSHQYSKYTFSDVHVTAVRSILATPPVNDPDQKFKFIALEIRATEQLNGVIDNLSVYGKSVLPVWTGTSWENQETNNCAWGYVETCSGAQLQNPVPLDKVDEAAMLDWANWCTANGFTYNNVHDSAITMLEYLRIIASTGRAQWAIQDGLFSVIRDTDDTVRKQKISPRNSRNFRAKKFFPDPPHALKVKWRNPVSLDTDVRIVYADGYDETNATKFEELTTIGVDNPDQAWKTGRYHLGDMILRPEEFYTTMDFEHLKVRRGALVGLSHDVILVGISWGRIKQVISTTQVETDERLPFEDGKSYVIGFRKNDNTQELVTCTGSVGYNTIIDLGAVVTDLNKGDLFTFGEAGKESMDAKVKSIVCHADLSADLTLVPAAPEIHQADQGEIPAYDPVMTKPINPLVMTPAIPDLVLFETFESLSGSTITAQTIVGFNVKSGIPAADRVEIRYRYDGIWKSIQAEPVEGISQILDVPAEGTNVDYQIRARSVHKVWSPWSATTVYTVAYEKTILPDNVTGLTADVVQDGIKLEWDHIPALQIIRYKLREGDAWETGTPVWDGLASSFTDKNKTAGAARWWIVSIDSGGRISTPVSVEITIQNPSDPVINYNIAGSIAQLSWDDCQTSFPILHYRVVSGSDIHFITNTQYAETITWTGSKDITVQAIDFGGNVSAAVTQAVVSPNAPAITSLTATGSVHSIILNVGYAWTDPAEIKLVEIWEATTNNLSTANLIKTLEPGKHVYIRPGVDLLENRFYWARLQNRSDVYSDYYPAGSTSGVAGTPSSDTDDYIQMFDAIISEGDLLSQFSWSSMKDFFEWEGTGRYTIQDGNEAVGLANAVVNGLGAIEERLSVIDTANAPDYDPEEIYGIGRVVNYEGGFHRKKLAGPAGIAPSNVTYWQSMAAGILNQWVMKMNANGHVAGVGLSLNDSGDSEFIIQADKFAVVTDDPENPGTPVSMFQVGQVGGVNQVGFRGDMMLDGTLSATALLGQILRSQAVTTSGAAVSEFNLNSGLLTTRAADDNARVVLDSGQLKYYRTFGTTEVEYKTVQRVVKGFASHGDTVELGFFTSEPDVILEAVGDGLKTYSAANSAVDQKYKLQVLNLREIDPDTKADSSGSQYYAFEVAAYLATDPGEGDQTVSITKTSSSDPGTITIDENDSATMTTPDNCNAVSVEVDVKSVRGTGSSGQYYNRQATVRLYIDNVLEATQVLTTVLAGQQDAVRATIGKTALAADEHDVKITCEYGNDSGTFGSVSYEYSNPEASSTPNQTAFAEGEISGGVAYPDSDTETINIPQPSISGWTVLSVDYSMDYNYSLSSVVGGGASPGTTAYVRSEFFDFTRGISGTTTSRTGSETAEITKSTLESSFTIQAFGRAFVGSGSNWYVGEEATITCTSLTVTAHLRRTVAGSSTPANELSVVEYTYDLTQGTVVATGDVKFSSDGD